MNPREELQRYRKLAEAVAADELNLMGTTEFFTVLDALEAVLDCVDAYTGTEVVDFVHNTLFEILAARYG